MSSDAAEPWFVGHSLEGASEKRERDLESEKEGGLSLMKQIGPRPMGLLFCTLALSHTPPVGEEYGRWALDWASSPNFLQYSIFQHCTPLFGLKS